MESDRQAFTGAGIDAVDQGLALSAALAGNEVVSANVHRGCLKNQEWAVDQVTAPICQGTNSFCP
ncbi:hypothetical protein D3C80_2197180 [compost metagenome]